MITAHQLYNYITDHAGTYGMKPLRMSKAAVTTDNKKGAPSTDLHEYALVALWNRYFFILFIYFEQQKDTNKNTISMLPHTEKNVYKVL